MKRFSNQISFIILFLFIVFFINSCGVNKNLSSFEKIKVLDFKSSYQTDKDTPVVVNWNFQNADEVRISEIDSLFSAKDKCAFNLEKTKKYQVTATNSIDTVREEFVIYVMNADEDIVSGPDSLYKPFNQPNIENTDYLSGIMPKEVRHTFNKLKVMRYEESGDNLILNILPIDGFGNFVTNLSSDELSFSYQLSKDGINFPSNFQFLKEKKIEDSSEREHIYILLENSLASFDLEKILGQIRTSLQYFFPNDLVSLSFYNQSITKIISSVFPSNAFLKINPSSQIKYSGTNSDASALLSTLKDISEIKEKALIVQISFSGDNSSITSSLTDISDISRKMNVPIYTIGIGTDVRSYQLEPLSQSTGARFYFLSSSQIEDIHSILNEIYFSSKIGYQYKLNYDSKLEKLDDLQFNVSYYNSSDFIDDTITIFPKAPEIFIPFQIISVFDYASSFVKDEYQSKILELASLLKDNPKMLIEIVGYTNFEMAKADQDKQLSLERAQNIRDLLISNGANIEQIRVSGRDNQNPLYYMPNKEWQLTYNRRAEVRWLDPSQLPFEIVAEIAVSETEALKYVENWEKQGYRSYFQRFVDNNDVKYKVKIWGFATDSEANTELRKLQFKFQKISFSVE